MKTIILLYKKRVDLSAVYLAGVSLIAVCLTTVFGAALQLKGIFSQKLFFFHSFILLRLADGTIFRTQNLKEKPADQVLPSSAQL